MGSDSSKMQIIHDLSFVPLYFGFSTNVFQFGEFQSMFENCSKKSYNFLTFFDLLEFILLAFYWNKNTLGD